MEELETLVEETIARLEKKFDTDNLWRSTEGDTAYIAIGNLWESVGDEIRTAYIAGMEKVVGELLRECKKELKWANKRKKAVTLTMWKSQEIGYKKACLDFRTLIERYRIQAESSIKEDVAKLNI